MVRCRFRSHIMLTRLMFVARSQLGRNKEALDMKREVLGCLRAKHGDRHLETLTAMGNLASSYDKLKLYKTSLPIHKEVYKTRCEVLGERHPNTLLAWHNVGRTLRDLGKFMKACAIYEKLVPLSKEVLGEWHSDTIGYQAELFMALDDAGRTKEALRAEKEYKRLKKLGKRSRKPRAAAKLGLKYRCAKCQTADKKLKCCSLCLSVWYCSEGA